MEWKNFNEMSKEQLESIIDICRENNWCINIVPELEEVKRELRETKLKQLGI